MAAVPSIGRANRVDRARAAEAEATRALYERYANQIFRYCLHQLGSREEAEDAVQSTFLNAFRGLRRGVVPELESAWLFKIAHNVCLTRRRSTWRRGRIEAPADFEAVQEVAPAPTRRADELIGLQDVLTEMPENQRRAILLREWQGLSYREIAEELHVSQAAIETLIFRARRTLASGLEQPPAPRRRRVVGGSVGGNLLVALKSVVVGGGVAGKVAATVAVVSATAIVASQDLGAHHARPHASPRRAVALGPTAQAKRGTAATVVRSLAPVTHRHAAPRPSAIVVRRLTPAAVVKPRAASATKPRQIDARSQPAKVRVRAKPVRAGSAAPRRRPAPAASSAVRERRDGAARHAFPAPRGAKRTARGKKTGRAAPTPRPETAPASHERAAPPTPAHARGTAGGAHAQGGGPQADTKPN